MRAVYDLGQSPATFDFVHWLANAERARQASGDPTIQVVFVDGDRQLSERDILFSPERKAWRLHNLLVPLCRLLPSVSGYEVFGTGKQTISYNFDRKSVAPILHATEAARDLAAAWLRTNKPVVTVTIRQSDFQLPRNSNLAEWKKTADWLTEQGCRVVFIPDAEADLSGEAMGDLEKTYRICEPAALYPDFRLALYERALLNCFTSGGPYALALYSGVPFFSCKLITPEIHTCTEWYQKKIGLAPDLPMAPCQQICWKDDQFELIKPNLEALLAECRLLPRPLRKFYSFAVQNAARHEHIKASVARGLPKVALVEPHERTMAIVCYGPSLKRFWPYLKDTTADIFTCSGAHDFLMDRGIVPKGHVATDPRKEQVDFIQHVHPAITYYVASCCHPDLFDALKERPVQLWHADEGEALEKTMLAVDPEAFFIGGGSNVGLRMIGLGTALGYRKFIIYGMDCSLEDGQRHAGPHNGKPQKVFDVHHQGSSKTFQTTSQLISGAREFLEIARHLVKKGYEFDVVGDGLLPDMLRMSMRTSQESTVATQPQEVSP